MIICIAIQSMEGGKKENNSLQRKSLIGSIIRILDGTYQLSLAKIVGLPLHVFDVEPLLQHVLPRCLDKLLLNQVALIHLLSLPDP